jgi:type I site-specific restriction-modification system R (restriction) subunit
MDVALQSQTISRYILEYIWGKMLNDLQSRIEEKLFSLNKAMEIEKEFREYIQNVVDVEMRKAQGNDLNANQIDIMRIFNNCYEVLFDENT